MKYYDTQSNVDSNIAHIESSLLEIQKSEKNLCDLVKQFETQLHDHHKSVGSMLTDHVSGVAAKVTKCCKTLASNSSSVSSSVAVNVVQLLVQFEKENAKTKILGKSYLLKSMEPYSDVYVSVDMTKSEKIKHKQIADELKSRRAN